MTLKETEVILEAIRLTYPNTFAYTEEDMPKVISIWGSLLEEIPYSDMNTALKTYIMTNRSGYAPTVGQLMGIITEAKTSNYPTAEEAWSLVRKAVANGLYGALEEFNALPPICQRLVGDPSQIYDWANLDHEGLSVARSLFLRRYGEELSKEGELLALPTKVAENRQKLAEGQDKVKLLADKIGGRE